MRCARCAAIVRLRVGETRPTTLRCVGSGSDTHSQSRCLPHLSRSSVTSPWLSSLWSSSTSWLAGASPLVPGVRPPRLHTSLPHTQASQASSQLVDAESHHCSHGPSRRAGYRLVILQAAKGQSLFLQAEGIKGHWNKILASASLPQLDFSVRGACWEVGGLTWIAQG